MAQRFVVPVAVATLAMSLIASAGEPDGGTKGRGAWTLTDRSFGPVKVGMRVREAAKAAGVKLRADPAEANEPCHYVASGGPVDGVAFMVQDGRISRIDVDAGPHKTASGVGIGSTERELRQRHPSLVETPGFYDPAERDLRVVSADGKHAILFVVRDGKVTAFRSGLRDAVEYVEGCQ